MADFIKPQEEQAVPDFGGYRSVDWSGIGRAAASIGGAIEMYGEKQKTDDQSGAAAFLEEGADKAWTSSGLGSATTDTDESGLPADVVNKAMRLSEAASSHSGNKGALYATQLEVYVKEARRRYPLADVDKLVKKITGINPREYNLKLYQEGVDAQTRKNLETNKYFRENAEKNPVIAGYMQAFEGNIPPEAHDKVMRDAMKYSSQQALAENDINARAAVDGMEVFAPVTAMQARFGDQLVPALLKDPQLMKAALAQVGSMKIELTDRKMKAIAKWPQKAKEIEAAYKIQLEVIDLYNKGLTEGDSAPINLAATMNKLAEDNKKALLLQDAILGPAMVLNANGVKIDFTDQFFKSAYVQGAIANTKSDDWIGSVLGSTVDQRSIAQGQPMLTLSDMVLRDNQQGSSGRLVGGYTNAITGGLADPASAPNVAGGAAEAIYTPGQLDQMVSKLNKGDLSFLVKTTGRAVVDGLFDNIDGDKQSQALAAMNLAFTKSKEAQDLVRELQRLGAGENGYFQESADGSVKFVSSLDPRFNQAAAVKLELPKLEALMGNLKYAYEKAGQAEEWEVAKAEIFRVSQLEIRSPSGTEAAAKGDLNTAQFKRQSSAESTKLDAGETSLSTTGVEQGQTQEIFIPEGIPAEVARDTEFHQGVGSLSQKYGFDTSDFWGLFSVETGGSFSPSQKAYGNASSATGLIQFLESTAESLGTTTEKLAGMTRAEQLQYVDKYLSQWETKLKKSNDPLDLYLAVLAPVGIGKADDYKVFKKGTKQYEANKSIDKDGNGFITKGEIRKRYDSHTAPMRLQAQARSLDSAVNSLKAFLLEQEG